MRHVLDSIDEMIVWRALQGFIGGGMIPTVFASAFTIFPPEKRPIVSPIIGLVATLAPTIGPTVGGYLTDLFSWHWLFLVNIVPGIFVTVSTYLLVDFDEPDLEPLQDASTGPASPSWRRSSAASNTCSRRGRPTTGSRTSSCSCSPWSASRRASPSSIAPSRPRQPIVDLRAFKDRNFAAGCAFSFVMGIGLYGLTYLYPLYLARVRGYSALQIGETMFVTGVCMFLMAPVAGRLSRKLDPRVMMAMGFVGFAIGTW